MELRVGLTHVIFDAGKLVLPGVGRAGIQLRFELPAARICGPEA
jgi:hypothetical protein